LKVPETALAEHLPPLTPQQAFVESSRCLFCYNAPCTNACPTHIDVPAFIKKISTGNLYGSARTIFESNMLGATCSRVCPVQELCEGACVLGAEHEPISIGRLQRFAMDYAYSSGKQFFQAGKPTGMSVAIIGAGPAGIACAAELAKLGYRVCVFDKHELGGGLSTYGIISLREPIEIALAEIEMVKQLGVEFQTGVEVGRHIQPTDLKAQYQAVFISAGLGATPELGIPEEEFIDDGLLFVEQSKTSLEHLKVGQNVIVIGAGNTAIDCATIAKRLGADSVTIIYRRSQNEMSAYQHEYEFALAEGIQFRFLTQPVKVVVENDSPVALECVAMKLDAVDASGRRASSQIPGCNFTLPADQIIKAIGQQKPSLAALLGLKTTKGFLDVDADYETSLPGFFAGGDCIRSAGSCSTVMAVQDGKLAARAMHKKLSQKVS
jgi:glutamate synthase (NADPH/NADH) small chain